MTKLNIHEAKTHLSRYIELVQQGQTITICKNGHPVAVLAPLSPKNRSKKQLFGYGKGRILESFFDELTDEELPGFGL